MSQRITSDNTQQKWPLGGATPSSRKFPNQSLKRNKNMNNLPSKPNPSIPDFPGIVIDPVTGRACALPWDVARGLGLHHEQVKRCAPRMHQGRYADVLDVIEARTRTPKAGRPKSVKAGMILCDLISALAATITGGVIAVTVIASVGKETAPTLSRTQEMNVRMLEDFNMSGAASARAQRDTQKAVANARIADLATLTNGNQLP